MKKHYLLLLLALPAMLMSCQAGPTGLQGEKGETGQKGSDGRGIVSIVLTSSAGNRDTYTIIYTDGSTSVFYVTNGEGGIQGEPGKDGHTPIVTIGENGNWFIDGVDSGFRAQGPKGDPGENGISVVSIAKTASEGNKDTYTITYSDGSTSTFVVTNGSDGAQGIQGIPGEDGHSPVISIGENGDWYVDGTDTGMKAQGPKGDKGDKGEDAITYIPCIFNNYDGTKLYEFYYEKGTDIVYDGPTPTKITTDERGETLNWTFSGWDKSLENIQKPTIFTAQFEYLYTCTFLNYDGAVLQTGEVNRGESAVYSGSIPTKPSEKSGDQTIEWEFNGWDKSLDDIKCDTIFTAQFDAPNAIKLTFKNDDGSTLYTQYCGVNATAKYAGPTPTKEDVDDGNGNITKYEFSGWDKPLKGIKADTIFTATYTETPYYRCRFYDGDGTLLYTTSTFSGGYVQYQGITPTKPQEADGTIVTEYTFSDWDASLSNISTPTDFHPVFVSNSFTGYKVTFIDSDNKTELYSHYFKAGTAATYPYETPWSYDDKNVTMFFGWSESISSITKATTVSMRVKTIAREQNGEYPQTKVTDQETINALELLSKPADGDYIQYGGEKYALRKSDYYKVEPIQWRYLSQYDGSALLLSEKVLDARRYNAFWDGKNENGYYANNYKQSEIRKWLNGEFLENAFGDEDLIQTTAVDNSASSTGVKENPYACETTYDKVFLLSYQEATNKDYGFDSDGFDPDESRLAYATDYAVSQVVSQWVYIDSSSFRWWLRSPDSNSSDYAGYVDYGGSVNKEDFVFHSDFGVRPAIRININ